MNHLTPSDIRLKSDIEMVQDALAKVNQLNGYTFTYTNDKDKRQHIGLLAQEVLTQVPEAVSEDKHGTLSVSYCSLVALLIPAINELTREVNSLKEKLANK